MKAFVGARVPAGTACRRTKLRDFKQTMTGDDSKREGRRKNKNNKGPPLEFRPRALSSERKPRKSEAPQELAAALKEKRRTVERKQNALLLLAKASASICPALEARRDFFEV